MTQKKNPYRYPYLVSTVIAATLIVISAVTMISWHVNFPLYREVVQSIAGTHSHLMIGMLAAGLSLWLQRGPLPLHSAGGIRQRSVRGCARLLAAFVVLLGIINLLKNIVGLGLSIDQFFFHGAPGIYTFRIGSMAYLSSICMALSGISLFLLDFIDKESRYPAEYCALVVALIMSIPLIGYLYGVTSLIQLSPASPVSRQAPFLFLMLTAGILCARPSHQLMAVFFSHAPGGLLLRRLLPIVLTLLVILNLLTEAGARHGLYGTDMVSPLSILVDTGLLFILFWRAAFLLNTEYGIRIQGQAALAQTNRLIRAVSDNTADAIFVKNREGRLIFGNPALENVVGMTVTAALGRTSIELVSDKETAATIDENDRSVMQSGTTQVFEETVALENNVRTYHSTKSPWYNEYGEILGIVGISTDITERKRIEEALKAHEIKLEALVAARTAEVRELFGHLEITREEEKRALARELHDDLGSSLTALNMHLAIIFKQVADNSAVTERTVQVKTLLNAITATTRRIQNGLRPDKLDIFGIKTAITEQASEFENYTGVACKVNLPDEDIAYPSQVEISLFRMVQEALNNIAKHAQANRVDIVLDDTEEDIHLTIRDDGIGMEVSDNNTSRTHGLRGMRERATYLGGRIDIISAVGKGTKLQISLPKALNCSSRDPI